MTEIFQFSVYCLVEYFVPFIHLERPDPELSENY